MNAIAAAAVALAVGVLVGVSVKPAAADASDELHRSREALERIAHVLEQKCR